jgi:hypothetical protein
MWSLYMARFHASVFLDEVLSEINQGNLSASLTLILLTWRIWWARYNASKWQMGFNLAFKGLIQCRIFVLQMQKVYTASRKCRISCFEVVVVKWNQQQNLSILHLFNSMQFNLFSSIKSNTSSRELLDIELVITIYIYIHYIHVQTI